MPIYEFVCPSCNRVYSFLARGSDDAERRPECPRCGNEQMQKKMSRFAFVRRMGSRSGPADDAAGPDALDDPRVEREMMKLMRDAEGLDENDPRQLGRLMRRMSEITGEPLEGEMEEAVRRLESGEDPEKIEEDLGDSLDAGLAGAGSAGPPPSYDDGLYDF